MKYLLKTNTIVFKLILFLNIIDLNSANKSKSFENFSSDEKSFE